MCGWSRSLDGFLVLLLLGCASSTFAQLNDPLASLQLWNASGCTGQTPYDSTWVDLTSLTASQVLVGSTNSSLAPCVSGGLGLGVASLQAACAQLPVANSSQTTAAFSASIWLTAPGCPAAITPDVNYQFSGGMSSFLPNCSLGLATLFNSSSGAVRRVAIYGKFTCQAPPSSGAVHGSSAGAWSALIAIAITVAAQAAL